MVEENIKNILKDYKEETKRHFDVVAEDLKGEIKTVAEQVGANTENITAIKEDVHQIKDDIEIIKEVLKKAKLRLPNASWRDILLVTVPKGLTVVY